MRRKGITFVKTRWLLVLGAAFSLWAGGCTQYALPKKICPGKETSAEAIASLQAHLDRARALRISRVRATMGYLDDRNIRRKASLRMNIFLEPPHNVFMRGQAMIGAKGVVSMGSNKEEFWLSIKPNVNSYWWGKWSEVSGTEQLQISPQVVLEALGMLDLGQQPERWFKTSEGGDDVLTLVNERGTIARQLVINTCDYLPRKIKYFDRFGELLALVELGAYETVVGKFEIPTRIQISNFAGQALTDWLELDFDAKSVDAREYSDRFRQQYFTRREPKGYDKVHRITSQEE